MVKPASGIKFNIKILLLLVLTKLAISISPRPVVLYKATMPLSTMYYCTSYCRTKGEHISICSTLV